MENWKNISEKEEWVNKAGLVTLFLMNWETPILDIVLKFLNTLLIKAHIYFGYQDNLYMISK
jgi:hypothetical protein